MYDVAAIHGRASLEPTHLQHKGRRSRQQRKPAALHRLQHERNKYQHHRGHAGAQARQPPSSTMSGFVSRESPPVPPLHTSPVAHACVRRWRGLGDSLRAGTDASAAATPHLGATMLG